MSCEIQIIVFSADHEGKKAQTNTVPVVQVSPEGQIPIPKKIREKYGVKPGSTVQIFEETDGIVIKPAPEDPIAAACGFLEGDFSLTDDLIEEHRNAPSVWM